ncbi:MAG: hypothetical protein KGL25_08015, partial [Gammaproteobacteria bacterium]|nr:hypothetical protein [Gammaproteobacteria bacterium]
MIVPVLALWLASGAARAQALSSPVLASIHETLSPVQQQAIPREVVWCQACEDCEVTNALLGSASSPSVAGQLRCCSDGVYALPRSLTADVLTIYGPEIQGAVLVWTGMTGTAPGSLAGRSVGLAGVRSAGARAIGPIFAPTIDLSPAEDN